MPQTKEENEKDYSAAQREKAKVARRLYHRIGTPSVCNFKYIVRSNRIRNCPVTVEDINIAEKSMGRISHTLRVRQLDGTQQQLQL